jgi:hypothetical protein
LIQKGPKGVAELKCWSKQCIGLVHPCVPVGAPLSKNFGWLLWPPPIYMYLEIEVYYIYLLYVLSCYHLQVGPYRCGVTAWYYTISWVFCFSFKKKKDRELLSFLTSGWGFYSLLIPRGGNKESTKNPNQQFPKNKGHLLRNNSQELVVMPCFASNWACPQKQMKLIFLPVKGMPIHYFCCYICKEFSHL